MANRFLTAAFAMTLCATAAHAQYGATAAAQLTVSELQTRDFYGVTAHVYDATVTWTGSCTKGENNGFGGNLESSLPTVLPKGETASIGGMGGSGTAVYESIEPGRVIRAKAYAACSDNGGQQTADHHTEPVVLPVHFSHNPMIFSKQPPEFFNCLPVGTEVQVVYGWPSIGLDGEEIEISIKGAGLAYSTRVAPDETNNLEILLKATTTGPVEITQTNHGTWSDRPITARSNTFIVQADTHAKCTTTPGTDGEGDGDGDGDGDGTGEPDPSGSGDEQKSTGCSSVPAFSTVSLIALLSGALIRRRK